MQITQLYGQNDGDYVRMGLTLTKEDIDKLYEAYEGIRCQLIIDSHDVRPLVAFMYNLLLEAEK